MKRLDIVKKLVKEGFSEKTLVNFSDKQLAKLSNMMISETLNIPKEDKQAIDKAKLDKKEFDTYEGELSEKWGTDAEVKKTGEYEGKTIEQLESMLKNLKKKSEVYQNKGEAVPDNIKKKEKQVMFAIRAKKNWKGGIDEAKPSAGLSKEKKSEVVKKAKKGGDIGKKGKGFEKVEKQAKKYGAKNPKAVAAAAMWKNIQREGIEKETIKEWVKNLSENKYYSLTLKKEIMEVVDEKIKEFTNKKVVKKAHKGIPEFMTYDAIKGDVAEPTTKPKTPVTKPGTRPRPKTPYQPGPGTNPNPKAMGDKKI